MIAPKMPLAETILGDISTTLAGLPHHAAVHQLLQSLLRAARARLGMEVAFIAEFEAGERIFRYVDADPGNTLIKVGDGNPLEQSYCARIVEGTLPELIPDAQQHPVAATIEATHTVPVGAHISVPLKLADGRVYGTFCAFSRRPNQDLDGRDLAFLRVLADISAVYLEQHLHARASEDTVRRNLRSLIENRQISTQFQPIVCLADGCTTGYEALTRTVAHRIPPDKLFKLAALHGLTDPLVELAMESTFHSSLTLAQDAYISVNAGPDELLTGLVEKLFRQQRAPARYVLEITEHAIVNDYQEMLTCLTRLRQLGVRIAVDDAGAGYASFRHILNLKPDIIKLDISLVRNIHVDRDRQDLIAAIAEFSRRRGYALVAEGLETPQELQELIKLNVQYVQGYLLSRPRSACEFGNQPGAIQPGAIYEAILRRCN